MSDQHGLGPGWYPHQGTPNALRYWDGTRWTEALAPMPVMQRPDELPDWVSVTGYITMLLFPIAGFVIGVIHAAKGQIGAGVAMILVSLVAALFWAGAVANSVSSPYY